MPAYAFQTVDVFTDQRFGGNPLAVFTDARGMSDAQMQALAREFNLSETTFVLPPEDPANTARVRIFTPANELPFAGHPNVGTGYVLAKMGRAKGGVLRFEELAGLVEVRVEGEGATIAAPQALSVGLELPEELIAQCVGLRPEDIVLDDHPPQVASVGNPFVLAEVRPDALARAKADVAAFDAGVRDWPTLNGRLGIYLYAPGRDAIRTRMFAPHFGIVEDPATGSAAVALAAYLLSLDDSLDDDVEEDAYELIQGVEMGRPSRLSCTARRTADGVRSTVGGGCVPVLRGEAEI